MTSRCPTRSIGALSDNRPIVPQPSNDRIEGRPTGFRNRYRLAPGARAKLDQIDPKATNGFENGSVVDALSHTSTPLAPWYIIPVNYKWSRDLAVAEIVASTLDHLKIEVPEPSVDINAIGHTYRKAVRATMT